MNYIISLSEWGNKSRYIVGAKRQIELAKKYYPNWKVRIYTDNAANYADCEVEVIEVKESTYGVFWRFRALFESEDNIVMIRDCDGRTTVREAMAVEEWLASDKIFHSFKDHEAHFAFPVMAGTFALKGKLSTQLNNIMKVFENGRHVYTSDQIYLRDYAFKEVANSYMLHSMNEGWFAETRKKLVNPYSFCGNGYDENDMPLYPDTLAACQGFDYKTVPEKFKFDEGILTT